MDKIIAIMTIFLVTLIPTALADEPRYNFATSTATGTITVYPGETVRVPAIYFFNINGNRITHVTLSLTSAPEELDLKIEPEIHQAWANISGETVNYTENLYVEPAQAVKEVPTQPPQDINYIVLAGANGYIPVKTAYLNITTPSSAKIGTTHQVSVRAAAKWLGQSGVVVLSQERAFGFRIQINARELKEEIISGNQPKQEQGQGIGQPYIQGTILIASIFGVILLIRRVKNNGKQRKKRYRIVG